MEAEASGNIFLSLQILATHAASPLVQLGQLPRWHVHATCALVARTNAHGEQVADIGAKSVAHKDHFPSNVAG